jgi:hypothetical protein
MGPLVTGRGLRSSVCSWRNARAWRRSWACSFSRAGLELAPVLATELLNFKVKVNIASGHDSYEVWRESIHDDLVLSVAMACWWGENQGAPAGVWVV